MSPWGRNCWAGRAGQSLQPGAGLPPGNTGRALSPARLVQRPQARPPLWAPFKLPGAPVNLGSIRTPQAHPTASADPTTQTSFLETSNTAGSSSSEAMTETKHRVATAGVSESVTVSIFGMLCHRQPRARPRFVAPQSLPRPCRQAPGPPVHLLSLWAPLFGAVMCPAQPPPVLLCWGLAAPCCESAQRRPSLLSGAEEYLPCAQHGFSGPTGPAELHVGIERFLMRSCLIRLWRLRSPQVCSQRAGAPGLWVLEFPA